MPKLVTPNTIRIRWQNLRPFFSWWAKEYESANPFDQADVPKLDEAAVPVVPYESLRLLIHACDGKGFENKRDEALIRLMVGTGARVGEVVAMSTDSWNRHTDVVILTGKTGTRTYPLSPAVGEAMSRYARLRLQHPKAELSALWLGLRGKLNTGGRRGDAVPPLRPGRHRTRAPSCSATFLGSLRQDAGRVRGRPDGPRWLVVDADGAQVRTLRRS